MTERKVVKLSDIKEHISCYLCKGFLVEATTIIECLHTFCKSCIVKYLTDSNNTCPKCENVIHQSHPLQYISFDRTLQDIVHKLVPGLKQPKEATNDSNNNVNSQGQENSKSKSSDDGNKLKPIDTNGVAAKDTKSSPYEYHLEDEQVNLFVSPHPSCELKALKNRYIRLSILATVTHLKKYIALRLYNDMERFQELDIFCDDYRLEKDYNFMYVIKSRWWRKVQPVKITYKPRSDD